MYLLNMFYLLYNFWKMKSEEGEDDKDLRKTVAVQSFSHVRFFVATWTAIHQVSLSFTISGAWSNSCPLSQWYHPTISSFVVPSFSCLLYFPPSGFFPVSQFFISDGQTIGASAAASVLPMNIQDWFPLGLF